MSAKSPVGKVWGAWAAGMLALCALRAGAAPQIDPAVDALLHKTAELYQKTQGWSAVLDMRQHLTMPGERHDTVTSATLLARRPHLIALKGMGTMLGGVYLNGRSVTLLNNQFHQYRLLEQPDFNQLRDDTEVQQLSGETLGLILPLFSDDPYAQLLRDAKSVTLEGDDNVDGVAAKRLLIDELPNRVRMWIAAGEQPRVLQFAPERQVTVAQQNVQTSGAQVVAPKLGVTIALRDQQFDVVLEGSEFQPKLEGYERTQEFGPPQQAVADTDTMTTEQMQAARAAAEKAAEEEEAKNELMNKPVPTFKLKTLEGKDFDLAKEIGKGIIVLDFWATWCGPCRMAMPMIIKATEAYKDKGVVFYSVDEQEEPAEIRTLLAKEGWKLNVLLDADGKAGEPFKIEGIPFTVIIDKKGIVRRVFLGAHEDEDKKLMEVFDTLLKAKP